MPWIPLHEKQLPSRGLLGWVCWLIAHQKTDQQSSLGCMGVAILQQNEIQIMNNNE